MKKHLFIKLSLLLLLVIWNAHAWAVTYNPSGVAQQTMQSQQVMQTGGVYNGTVYEPFSSTTPSEASNPANGAGPRRISQDGRNAGDATEATTESPIGEPWVLFLFAVAFAGVIAIRQYKKNLKVTENSNNSTMKRFNLFKMLAVLIVLITSINTVWAAEFTAGKKLYLKDFYNSDLKTTWKTSGGAARAFFISDDNGCKWVQFDLVSGSWDTSGDVYAVIVPAGGPYTRVVITRGNGSINGSGTNWSDGHSGNTWMHQTVDIQAPSGDNAGKNLISIGSSKDGSGHYSSITWEKYANNAYIEGRFHMQTAIGSGSWTNTFNCNDCNWDESSKLIPMTWDATNKRFYLHTNATVANLAGNISNYAPVFYIKTSRNSNLDHSDGLTGAFQATSSQTFTDSNGKEGSEITLYTTGSGRANDNLKFSGTESSGGYVVLYFDPETGKIWYDLEYQVNFGKGAGGDAVSASDGSALSSGACVMSGTSVTFGHTPLTGYTWAEWNTASDGGGSQLSTDESYTVTIDGSNTTSGAFSAYSKYTENLTTYTAVSCNATMGSVGGTTSGSIGVATSQSVSATPTDGHYFTGWTQSGGEHIALAGHESDNPLTVHGDGTDGGTSTTLTANFASRFALIGTDDGDEYGDKNGMPGWGIHTYTFDYVAANDFERTVSLKGNTNYKFQLYDKKRENWLGYNSSWGIDLNGTGDHWVNCESNSKDITFTLNGSDEVTFKIKAFSGNTVNIEVLTSGSSTSYNTVYFHSRNFFVDGTKSTATTGGRIRAVDWQDYELTQGSTDKVKSGKDVTFTAIAEDGYTFDGWYTDEACSSAYDGDASDVAIDGATMTLSNISANKTVYAKFIENACTVRITASNYTFGTITVGGDDFDWGNTTTVGKTTKYNLVATPNEGYYFAGWVLSDGADFELQNDTGDEDNEVTLAGLGGTDGSTGLLTASFMPLDKIYFRNYNEETGANLWGAGSTNLYVYFYAYWDDKGQGAGALAKPYAQMQPIEPSSNIYWAYVPRDVTKTSASDKSHVAFSDVDFSGYKNFNGYHGVYRTDYNRITNMFVPNHTGTTPYNNTLYNSNGFWMKYNPQKGVGAGYYMQKWEEAGGYTQVAEMKPTYSGSTTLHFTLTIDDVSAEHNRYIVMSAGGVKYKANNTLTTGHTEEYVYENNDLHPYFSLTPTVKGDYNFTLDQSGDVMKISVEYPESAVAGDYRLENAYNDGSAKTTHSNIIKAANAGSSNTVSMYLCGEGSGTLKLQKCTGISDGEPTWDAGNTTNLTSVLSTVGANKGVYYFDISIADDAVTSAPTPVKYSGDYYVHVNASTRNHLDEGEPKWSSSIGNKFTHFTKNASFKDTYDYYWVDWFLSSSEGGGAQSVVATIGNDYNDDLAGKTPAGSTTTSGANVRYAYDSETNAFTRTMISGGGSDIKISAEDEGDVTIKNKSTGVYEDATTPRSAQDIDNWMYAFTAKVMPNSEADVTSTYDDDDLLLADDKKLIGGAGEDPYDVELIYDFKTNRIIAAWVPSGTISTAFDLQSNMMVIREEDDTPTIINLTGEGALNNVTQIYTVMEFGKYTWNDNSRTIVSGGGMYTDAYYWISLPYDCKVSDIFGIEGYGDYWTIQTYMGDLRAKSGWWAEIDNWWYNLDPEDVMKTGVGYVLRMTNLGYGPFAQVGVTKARLYFPSDNTANLKVEQLSSPTTKLDTLICHVWRKWKNDPNGRDGEGNPTFDRRAIDSNWRILGSPSFNSTKISGDPNFLEPDDPERDDDNLTWEDYKDSCAIRYLYTWEVISNQPRYTVTSTDGFEFKGTHAYLAQYAGTISWAAYDAENPLVGIKAPKRERATSLNKDFRLVLNQNGKQADVAYVSLMEERATADYDLNLDLSKMMNSKQANIYTFSGLYQMAANCLPISDSMTVVPVGVKLAQDGDYTFAMPEGTNGTGVYLIDNIAGTRTNLALTDYTVNLTAGTYDERFYLEISPIAQTPTDIEQTGADVMDGVRKVMVDGILYIVKDGRIYDATGNRVQ